MRSSIVSRCARRQGTVAFSPIACALAFFIATTAMPTAVDAQTPRLNVRGNELFYGDQPVYPFGQGFWHAVVKGGFDVTREANWYAPFQANFTRVKIVTTRIKAGATWKPENPWLLLTNNKYDLTRWNNTFWSRLDTFLRRNEQSGRFVILQIVDDVTMKQGTDAWDLHPLNPNRNINNLGLPGNGVSGKPDVYDVNDSRVMDVHRQLLNEVLNRTKQFGNVIYEIGNEYAGTKQFFDEMVAEIKAFEQFHNIDLLVTNMPSTVAQFDHEASHPDVDLLDFWHAPKSIRSLAPNQLHATMTSLYAKYGTKPLIAGRIGPEPDTEKDTPTWRGIARRDFWAILLGGGRGATTKEDEDDIENGPSAYDVSEDWEAEGILGLQTVLDNLLLQGPIEPRQQLVYSNGFQWTWASSSGPEFIAYVAGAGQGNVELTGVPASRYTVKVYDPERAQLLTTSRITVPSSGRVSVPVGALSSSDDRAVWLTPEPFDVSIRWEQLGNTYRLVLEGQDLPGLYGLSVRLNGVAEIVPWIQKVGVVTPITGGIRITTPYLALPPKAVYSFELTAFGPTWTDRSVSRLWVP